MRSPVKSITYRHLALNRKIRKPVKTSKPGIAEKITTEHFASRKIHCEYCGQRKLRDGTTEYFHAGLGAVLVNPAYEEVFPLDFEPILKPDGAKKNDCERNAAKRLCATLHERYHELHLLLVEDALYANAPHVRQITGYGWKFVLNVKPDSHQCLFQQFAGRQARGQVKERRETAAKGVQHVYRWTTGLCLNEGAIDVQVNFLWYEETDKKGQVTRWTWITNLPSTARTVEKVMWAGLFDLVCQGRTFQPFHGQEGPAVFRDAGIMYIHDMGM